MKGFLTGPPGVTKIFSLSCSPVHDKFLSTSNSHDSVIVGAKLLRVVFKTNFGCQHDVHGLPTQEPLPDRV